MQFNKPVRYLLAGLPVLGAMFLVSGKEYTGLMLIFLGAAVVSDRLLRTHLVVQKRTWLYFAGLLVCIFLFNGYLTGRPVVLYDEQYQLGIRLGTIPVEDFGYGFSHLLLTTIIYERIKMQANG
ncbi:MAG: lycopene cyclase domain-containing protein [candidate division KSB1 bacterium]|nr:lycopene cyclase domain-containing protein [candidate division KSB1 bacterium]